MTSQLLCIPPTWLHNYFISHPQGFGTITYPIFMTLELLYIISGLSLDTFGIMARSELHITWLVPKIYHRNFLSDLLIICAAIVYHFHYFHIYCTCEKHLTYWSLWLTWVFFITTLLLIPVFSESIAESIQIQFNSCLNEIKDTLNLPKAYQIVHWESNTIKERRVVNKWLWQHTWKEREGKMQSILLKLH